MDVSPAKRSYFTCANVWWKLLFHSTIRSTDSFQETVTEVSFDGSFYTETEMTGLYVDGKTTRIK